MPDSSAILRHKAFWPFYVRASNESLESGVLLHFDTKIVNGNQCPEAVITLPCGGDHSIDVSISPDLWSVNLGLRNTNTDFVAEMGWWDEAQWHPYALRWDELTKLHNYWVNHLGAEIQPSAAFLLLAIFVGHAVNDRSHFSDRKTVIRNHYEQLQLFSDAEITKLSNKTLVGPSEDDYYWTQDDELGWVFGGEYPCYSIRNREHSDGSEGRFPFAEWSAVMDRL